MVCEKIKTNLMDSKLIINNNTMRINLELKKKII